MAKTHKCKVTQSSVFILRAEHYYLPGTDCMNRRSLTRPDYLLKKQGRKGPIMDPFCHGHVSYVNHTHNILTTAHYLLCSIIFGIQIMTAMKQVGSLSVQSMWK